MKKNDKGFFSSLILFIFSTLLIIGTITKPIKTPDNQYLFTIIGLWIFQILSVMGIEKYFKKPKPNYNWSELEEEKIFTIISFVDNSFDGEFMEMNPDHFGHIVVNVEGFGETLMSFPSNLLAWQNKAPETGKNYMRVKNNFIQMVMDIKNNSL